jgi:hypothetical protein
VLVAMTLRVGGRSVGTIAMVLALPVYLLVMLVAAVPEVSEPFGLLPLQVEGFLTAAILVLGLHAVWFFSHHHHAVSAETNLE